MPNPNEDGSIENPFEEEHSERSEEAPKAKSRKRRKTVVFAVAEPTEKHSPVMLDVLEGRENTLLLHNRYDYSNEKGQAIVAQLKSKTPPTAPHLYEQMMRQEFWGIKQSDVVVFDLDSLESFHLMAVAAVYEKPIVCISETLRPVPPYFTGSVVGVFKSTELDMILKTVARKPRRRRKTADDVGDNELNELSRRSAEPTTTKDKLQGMLQKSLEKHADQIRQELR